jgi:anti-sigma B factor antagonist
MDGSRANDIRISVATADGNDAVQVVRVDGTVDTLTAGELDSVLGALTRQGRCRLVVDLAGVRYLSSAGWGVFISRLREARAGGGDIKLARMTPPVREIYDLLEFAGVLHHFEQLDSATAQFGGGNGGGSSDTGLVSQADSRLETASPLSRPSSSPLPSLETTVLQLVQEDPFYTIGELRTHVLAIGHGRVSWWTIVRVLWRRRLLGRNRRLAHYRRRIAADNTG